MYISKYIYIYICIHMCIYLYILMMSPTRFLVRCLNRSVAVSARPRPLSTGCSASASSSAAPSSATWPSSPCRRHRDSTPRAEGPCQHTSAQQQGGCRPQVRSLSHTTHTHTHARAHTHIHNTHTHTPCQHIREAAGRPPPPGT